MDNHNFIVTDLKQWAFCPRVVYYEKCLARVRPRTYKMDAGHEAHEDEQRRAARRTLTQYAVADGERHFEVLLASAALQLTGILDELVITTDGQYIPTDYKMAKSVGKNHRVQLMAYGLLLEETYQTTVSHGFILLIPLRKMVKIDLVPKLRQETLAILQQMQTMIQRETMPEPPVNRNQCPACEFRRFCNDV